MYKLMLVDDEDEVREGICATVDFEKCGFTLCAQATGAIDALEKAAQFQPDVVFTDVHMPYRDGMELKFPVMADCMALWLDGRKAFVTHGHLFNLGQLPNLNKGDLLIHGDTHVQAFTPFGQDNWYINPGSASIPKEDNDHSYMTYEDGVFTIKSMDGSVIRELRL